MMFKSQKVKTLFSNFISLSVLQGLNLILPLLTIPYLLAVIGVEKYGILAFVNAIVLYFQIVIEYGFNSTATRDISVFSSDKKKVEQLFNEVLSAKLFLLLIGIIILSVLVFSFPILRKHFELYFYSFGVVVGMAISPVWLFQGMQQMKYITYINVIFKTLFTLAIFVFVKNENQYWLVPVFTSSGFIFSGILTLIIVAKKFQIRFILQSFDSIVHQLKNGKHIFLSELQMTLLSNTNLLIIGFIAGNSSVGYYSSVEKVVRAISNLNAPIINALYPFISKEMVNDKENAIKIVNKVAKIGGSAILFLVFLCFLFSDYIINLIYAENFNEKAVLIFRIMILFPLLSFLDQVFGKLVLLNNGKDKEFLKVFFYSGCISLLLTCILTLYFDFIGTAIASTFAQILVAAGMFYYSIKIIRTK
ncbi:PST family polysaccharide transporter [Flavobacterium gossypii]|uniref:PST family polysaccharide transporter n=1 Tax=Flavobacterium gossypii TaxID=1646119 RepID=A0ABR6DPK4_9FLAO|nr:oligosaccharide flippase family protein [Flavobacterium gossypii]MBA9073364.1 PST family polysaccharide transporter [Flavobacterium gossypii]